VIHAGFGRSNGGEESEENGERGDHSASCMERRKECEREDERAVLDVCVRVKFRV
jgi:hypothetical protein